MFSLLTAGISSFQEDVVCELRGGGSLFGVHRDRRGRRLQHQERCHDAVQVRLTVVKSL